MLEFIAPAVAILLSFIPVFLLHRKAYARAHDYFVSSGSTPPSVIQNSAVAYALKMSTFGPLFIWGATGDLWPAILNSAFFGLGLSLMFALRRPILEFIGAALSGDRSMTMHAFIAQQHGNDRRVRLLTSSLTLSALIGLVVCETLALVSVFKPLISDNPGLVYWLAYPVLMLMALCTIVAGNSGVMRSAQLQLGMIYLGLFGSTILLLYMHISSLEPVPPYGTLGISFVALCCAVMLGYRRSRYVDNTPVSGPGSGFSFDSERLGAKLLIKFQKVLNPSISVFAVVVIVIALMDLYAGDFSAIAHKAADSLLAGTRTPTMGMVSLILLPLFYQLVDITNWQRMAVFAKDRGPSRAERAEWSSGFRRAWTIYVVEVPLMSLYLCMLGAIASLSTARPDEGDAPKTFIEQLVLQNNLVASTTVSLLLVALAMMALSTMTALFSASLYTLCYDILPKLFRGPIVAEGHAINELGPLRRIAIAGGVLYLIVVTAYYVASAVFQMAFASTQFLALLFASNCAQLALLPLVLGPLVDRGNASVGTVRTTWALIVVCAGAATGIGCVALYFGTGDELWLWAAVPACLGSGALFLVIAWASDAWRACRR